MKRSTIQSPFAAKKTAVMLNLAAMLLLALSACSGLLPAPAGTPTALPEGVPTVDASLPEPTPLPTRPPYGPGEMVDYIAQTGDTLPALAVRFNTTVREIRLANPQIPGDATTMPPGMPMKIPIYYEALWGSPYQIIPDSLFINGPAQIGFSAAEFVLQQPGWFKTYHVYAGGKERYGGELIDHIAENFSVSPRLLLALLEYQTGALSQTKTPDPLPSYLLGQRGSKYIGLYNQLIWAANTLNNAYYGWRTGRLDSFEHLDGRIERPDPWQNAATVALQFYYTRMLPRSAYDRATHANGFAATYQKLFGDPWVDVQAHIPVSLNQPEMHLPFLPGKTWAYTGGPHTNWGEGDPLTALDFAPPSVAGGCSESQDWATAVADGIIARTGDASAVLDLDGDGDERTGWVVFYLHLANQGLIRTGTLVKTGDPLGHPSCEGGTATGTHVHIARKYNGEWIPADGTLAFDLEGWIAGNGAQEYLGSLTRFSKTVYANSSGDGISHIAAQGRQ